MNLRLGGADAHSGRILVRSGLIDFGNAATRRHFLFDTILAIARGWCAIRLSSLSLTENWQFFGSSLSQRCSILDTIIHIERCFGSLGLIRTFSFFPLPAYFEVGELALHG